MPAGSVHDEACFLLSGWHLFPHVAKGRREKQNKTKQALN
jgi:hypothetical protein